MKAQTENLIAVKRRWGVTLAVLGLIYSISLMPIIPAVHATTWVKCTATNGFWRWGGGMARLDLSGVPDGSTTGNTYLDALRDTEHYQAPSSAHSDPNVASRAGLDVTMDERFTTGPQPWGNSYVDRRVVGLTNFVSTTGDLIGDGHLSNTGFSLGVNCVPAGSTIHGAWVRVTHAIIDPNQARDELYAARIRVFDGSGFTAFDLTGNNLVGAGGAVPSSNIGIAHEATTNSAMGGAGDIDVTSVLNSAARVNDAIIQFQANRSAPAAAALRTIINEISLFVYYTPPTNPPLPSNGIKKLVTGGGYISSGTYSGGTANFGFNGRSNVEGGEFPSTFVAGSGNLQYTDGPLWVHGRVTELVCSTAPQTFILKGDYRARIGKGPWNQTGNFTATVTDKGEPGTADEFALQLSGGVNHNTGTQILTGGNIQFHFCDIP